LGDRFQPVFKTARLLVIARSYGFFRNSKLDANNSFQNRNGRPMASFKRNQFGGPITVPKFYNGEGRTFFFIDYGGQHGRAAGNAFHTAPPRWSVPAIFRHQYGALRLTLDLEMTRLDPSRPGFFIADAFPANRIPTNRTCLIGLQAQSYYPLPNASGLPFTRQQNLVLHDAYPESQDRLE